MRSTLEWRHVWTGLVGLVLGGSASVDAESNRLREGLPDTPVEIREDSQGRVYFAFGGPSGSLLVHDGGEFTTPARGDIKSVAPSGDGQIWYTAEGRVRRIASVGTSESADQTASFQGTPAGANRVFVTRVGEIWVEGCSRRLNARGEFRPVPDCSVRNCNPVPAAEDPFGNLWALVGPGAGCPGTRVVVLPAPGRTQWTSVGSEGSQCPGASSGLVVDGLGYVWVAGESGVARFDPRSSKSDWTAFPARDLPLTKVTALGLSPSGRALVGSEVGRLFELDLFADGKASASPIEMGGLPSAPVRAIHTDRDGALWVVAGGGIYRKASTRSWRELAPLPTGNHDFYGVLHDDRLYVAGGIAPYGLPAKMSAFDSFCAYDGRENRWVFLPNLPTRRGYCGIAALAGEIWVLGGYMYPDPSSERQQTLDVVEVFDLRTQSWRRGPSLDVPRAEMVALTVDGRLYVVGGADQKRELKSVISIGSGETGWRTEPEAPRTFRQSSGCVLDGRIYLARGRSDEHPSPPGLYVYDPDRRQWRTSIPAMPVGWPNAPITAVCGGDIWVMGGWGTQEPRASFRYSHRDGTWTRCPDLPIPLAWGGAADMGGHLIVVGGAYYSEKHRIFIFSDCAWALRRD